MNQTVVVILMAAAVLLSIAVFGTAQIAPIMVAIAGLGVLIFVHEAGHFLFGRVFKFKIKEFGLGFGPKLLGYQKGDILYSLRALPLGGFVKFNEEPPEEGKPPALGTFDAEKIWHRAVVVFAGAAMNLVIAVAVITFLISGSEIPTNTVAKVLSGTAADVAGVQAGDKIVSIDGVGVSGWDETRRIILRNGGETIPLVVERGGKELELEATMSYVQGFGFLGVEPTFVHLSAVGSLGAGVKMTADMIELMLNGIALIFRAPDVVLPQMTGPIGIIDVGSEAVRIGYATFLWLIALISINLAIVNLLPVPPLDGGRLLLLGVEAIIRRPVSQKIISVVQTVGLSVFLTLFIYLMYADIVRVFIEKRSVLGP